VMIRRLYAAPAPCLIRKSRPNMTSKKGTLSKAVIPHPLSRHPKSILMTPPLILQPITIIITTILTQHPHAQFRTRQISNTRPLRKQLLPIFSKAAIPAVPLVIQDAVLALDGLDGRNSSDEVRRHVMAFKRHAVDPRAFSCEVGGFAHSEVAGGGQVACVLGEEGRGVFPLGDLCLVYSVF
jgi:hypothetical protein